MYFWVDSSAEEVGVGRGGGVGWWCFFVWGGKKFGELFNFFFFFFFFFSRLEEVQQYCLTTKHYDFNVQKFQVHCQQKTLFVLLS